MGSSSHPDDLQPLLRTWAQCVKTGQSFLITYRLRRADGDYRWHEGRSEPWRDQAGNIVQWYGVNVDIDERMHAEHELRSTQARFLRASQLAASPSFRPRSPMRSINRWPR